MKKTLVLTTLGLLLLTGSSLAEKRKEFSPTKDVSSTVQREHSAAVTARQSFSAHTPLKAMQIHGVLNAKSHGRQTEIAGVRVTVSPQCALFPSAHVGKTHDLTRWNGRDVTVFGYETSSGMDARLVILNDAARNKFPRAVESSLRTIPSTSDPTVGEVRRDAPQ